MKRLKLTHEGIKSLQQELEAKKEELRKLGKYKSDAASNEGDAWHDNFAFEQTEIKERALVRQIKDLEEEINTAEIIEIEKNIGIDKINVGSTVTVLLKYSEEDEEEISFVLTGSYGDSGANHFSINSPIGEAVFGQSLGFEGKYMVNGNVIYFKILSVSN